MKINLPATWLRVGLAPTHDDIESQAYQYLTLRGWLVIRTHDDQHPPVEPGVSDFIALRRGRELLLEFKTGRDKPRPSQIDFADRAIRCGLEVHEVRMLDEVIALDHRYRAD